MKNQLEKKICLVTGGGSGIGEAIVLAFVRRGAKVFLLDLNEEGAKNVVTKMEQEGFDGNVVFKPCDVSSQENVKEICKNVEAEDGKIDVLVNNAGIAHVGNVENTRLEDIDRVYNVNVKGVYNCLHAVVPYMVKQKKGIILNLASIASKVGIKDRFAYSMSKGAVFAMTLSVARDYVEHGIRCNCVCPARVHTPFVDGFIEKNYPEEEREKVFQTLSEYQPMSRMGKPSEIASLVAFLCSDEASFITGSAYDIDGGVTLLR